MVIEYEAFGDLIFNCGTLGLSHHSKHLDFVPERRELTDGERKILHAPFRSEATSAVEKKVRQIFVEVSTAPIHIFANHHEWHCFHATFRDIAGDPTTGAHHWCEGRHLHYVSHLFTRLTRKEVWDALDQRVHSLPTEHIRFRHPDAGKRVQRFIHADGEAGTVVEIPAEEP